MVEIMTLQPRRVPVTSAIDKVQQQTSRMCTLILISTLAALVTAIPYPQTTDTSITPGATLISLSAILPVSTTTIPDSTSLNIPVTPVPTSDNDPEDEEDAESTSSKKYPHWEPIPIFTKQCQCQLATARYPCWATDALQVSKHTGIRGVQKA